MRKLKHSGMVIRVSVLGIATSAVLCPGLTAAADASGAAQAEVPQGTVLQEVIVTANRREESVQKVGISVTAVTGDFIQSVNIERPEDLSKLVPGMAAVPNAGSAVSSYAIRGVSQPDSAEHQEQPVAIYQDGVYVANAAATGFPIFDVQRAEVLRGPQGTLFGRNATGGLVQFISNQPTAGFEGQIGGALGDRNLHHVDGFVNGGSDTVSARLAIYHTDQDGFVNNTEGEDLLSRDVSAIRAQVKFQLGDATQLTLRGEGWNANGTADAGKNTPSFIDANGYSAFLPATIDYYGTGPGKDYYGYRDPSTDPLKRGVNDPGQIEKRARTLAATMTHDAGELTFSSITSFAHYRVDYREDTDSTPLLQTLYADGGDAHEFTQELRVQQATGAFRWTGGLYYFQIKGDYFTSYDLPTFCSPASPDSCAIPLSGPGAPADPALLPLDANVFFGSNARSDYSLETKSSAVFAQGELDLTDRLTLTLGARYTWDKQQYDYLFTCFETIADGCANIFGVGANPNSVSSLGLVHLNQDSGDWSGKLGLNFQATQDVLLYVSASKGLKGGGYGAVPDGLAVPSQVSFKPENLYAYEAGFKSTLLDRRLVLNGSIYSYDYHDYQTFSFSGITATVFNRDATNKGFELELIGRPWTGATANLSMGYTDFWVKDISTPRAPDGEKQRPINAPKKTINWGLSQEWPLSGALNLRVNYNGRYTDGRYFNIVNSPVVYAKPYTVHDASARLEIGEKLWLGVFVNNLTDKIYTNARFDQTFNSYALAHYGEPRTLSVSFGTKF